MLLSKETDNFYFYQKEVSIKNPMYNLFYDNPMYSLIQSLTKENQTKADDRLVLSIIEEQLLSETIYVADLFRYIDRSVPIFRKAILALAGGVSVLLLFLMKTMVRSNFSQPIMELT
jgi:hypothetical protein